MCNTYAMHNDNEEDMFEQYFGHNAPDVIPHTYTTYHSRNDAGDRHDVYSSPDNTESTEPTSLETVHQHNRNNVYQTRECIIYTGYYFISQCSHCFQTFVDHTHLPYIRCHVRDHHINKHGFDIVDVYLVTPKHVSPNDIQFEHLFPVTCIDLGSHTDPDYMFFLQEDSTDT